MDRVQPRLGFGKCQDWEGSNQSTTITKPEDWDLLQLEEQWGVGVCGRPHLLRDFWESGCGYVGRLHVSHTLFLYLYQATARLALQSPNLRPTKEATPTTDCGASTSLVRLRSPEK